MFILFRDISCAEVNKHKIYYYLVDGDIIEVYGAFAEILPVLLADRRFAQCHGSFVVNMDNVYKIQSSGVVMKGGEKVPISRAHSAFKKRYFEYMFGRKAE
jgi:DNA-binding LytR/AlgR family response regulator